MTFDESVAHVMEDIPEGLRDSMSTADTLLQLFTDTCRAYQYQVEAELNLVRTQRVYAESKAKFDRVLEDFKQLARKV